MKSNEGTAHTCQCALILPNVFIFHILPFSKEVFEFHHQFSLRSARLSELGEVEGS